MFTHTKTPNIVELPNRITHGQRWYTTPSGIKYPSVTTILDAKEKPYLEEWRQSLGPKKADKETKRCADRGTAVHKICEDYLNNVDSPAKGYEQLNIKLFNQIKLRLNKIDNIRAQEVPLYSEILKIAGRVDCVAEYDGVLSIIDFKTSNNNKNEKMVEDYFLQCTAYAIMYEELFGEFIEDIVVLIAVEKGLMPLCYKRKIDDYVRPLIKRINMFYKKNKGKS